VLTTDAACKRDKASGSSVSVVAMASQRTFVRQRATNGAVL